jgi:hypothetical protein
MWSNQSRPGQIWLTCSKYKNCHPTFTAVLFVLHGIYRIISVLTSSVPKGVSKERGVSIGKYAPPSVD